jgi:hypothetical protein
MQRGQRYGKNRQRQRPEVSHGPGRKRQWRGDGTRGMTEDDGGDEEVGDDDARGGGRSG